MALGIPLTHDVTLTQGSADAFVQGTIATGIVPADGLIQKIVRVVFQFNAQSFDGIASDCSVYWSIARDTKTAVAALSDADSILYDGLDIAFTTSGAVMVPLTYTYEPSDGFFIAEPNIYVQLDSNATGETMTCNVRMFYEEVRASEVDILRLLNG